MSFKDYAQDVATQAVDEGDGPAGVGPDPDGPYYCDVHQNERGEAVTWVLRDEEAVAHRWIVSSEGIALEDAR